MCITVHHAGSPKLLTESQLVDLWERIDARLSELCEDCEQLPDSLVPFDSASDIPMEEQKCVCVCGEGGGGCWFCVWGCLYVWGGGLYLLYV